MWRRVLAGGDSHRACAGAVGAGDGDTTLHKRGPIEEHELDFLSDLEDSLESGKAQGWNSLPTKAAPDERVLLQCRASPASGAGQRDAFTELCASLTLPVEVTAAFGHLYTCGFLGSCWPDWGFSVACESSASENDLVSISFNSARLLRWRRLRQDSKRSRAMWLLRPAEGVDVAVAHLATPAAPRSGSLLSALGLGGMGVGLADAEYGFGLQPARAGPPGSCKIFLYTRLTGSWTKGVFAGCTIGTVCPRSLRKIVKNLRACCPLPPTPCPRGAEQEKSTFELVPGIRSFSGDADRGCVYNEGHEEIDPSFRADVLEPAISNVERCSDLASHGVALPTDSGAARLGDGLDAPGETSSSSCLEGVAATCTSAAGAESCEVRGAWPCEARGGAPPGGASTASEPRAEGECSPGRGGDASPPGAARQGAGHGWPASATAGEGGAPRRPRHDGGPAAGAAGGRGGRPSSPASPAGLRARPREGLGPRSGGDGSDADGDAGPQGEGEAAACAGGGAEECCGGAEEAGEEEEQEVDALLLLLLGSQEEQEEQEGQEGELLQTPAPPHGSVALDASAGGHAQGSVPPAAPSDGEEPAAAAAAARGQRVGAGPRSQHAAPRQTLSSRTSLPPRPLPLVVRPRPRRGRAEGAGSGSPERVAEVKGEGEADGAGAGFSATSDDESTSASPVTPAPWDLAPDRGAAQAPGGSRTRPPGPTARRGAGGEPPVPRPPWGGPASPPSVACASEAGVAPSVAEAPPAPGRAPFVWGRPIAQARRPGRAPWRAAPPRAETAGGGGPTAPAWRGA